MKMSVDKLRGITAHSEDDTQTRFERLFHAHWERVFTILYRLVGDAAEAEDLALEVFWRLYRRPLPERVNLKLEGWLYRVAMNMGFNALRARARRQRYERASALSPHETDASTDPSQEYEKMEARALVQRVLSQMKPREARLLVLRHSGLSYAEVAAALKVSPGSVGTMLARAERNFELRYRAMEGGE